MGMIPPRSSRYSTTSARRSLPVASAVFYTGSALIGVGTVFAAVFSGRVRTSISSGALAFDAIALIFSFLATRADRLSPRARQAWKWFLLAAMLRFAGVATYLAASDSPGFPSTGDLLIALEFLPLACGIHTLPRRAVGRHERHKMLLDGTTVAVGSLLAMWFFIITPILADSAPSVAAIATAVGLPVGDMLMIFAAVATLDRTTEPAVKLPLLLLAIGWAWEFSATPYLGHLRVAEVPGEQFPTWLFALWLVAQFFYAAAAFEQCRTRHALVSPPVRRTSRYADRLPYLGIAVGLGVLFGSIDDASTSGVTIGVAILTVLVLLRQHLVLRENQQLAATDALTGLANRAHFIAELDRSLGQAQRTGRRVGVLLADLDEFKSINDGFGHATGDLALREFARMLRRAALGNDVVGRLGGDEFAIVLNDIGTAENIEAIVLRIHAETRNPVTVDGQPMVLKASVGSAVAAPGDRDGDALIRLADAEMYRVKLCTRGSRPTPSDAAQ